MIVRRSLTCLSLLLLVSACAGSDDVSAPVTQPDAQVAAASATALEFAGMLEDVASYGSAAYTIDRHSGSLADVDASKSVFLLDLLSQGKLPAQTTPSAALGFDDPRVLVFNANAGGTPRWTRLVCSEASCPTEGGFDNLPGGEFIGSGEDGKLPGPVERDPGVGNVLCIQVHQSGGDVFIGFRYGQPVVAKSVSICANPAGVPFHPADQVPVTNGVASYFDLAGQLVQDATWAN